jgi:hypothetical protein
MALCPNQLLLVPLSMPQMLLLNELWTRQPLPLAKAVKKMTKPRNVDASVFTRRGGMDVLRNISGVGGTTPKQGAGANATNTLPACTDDPRLDPNHVNYDSRVDPKNPAYNSVLTSRFCFRCYS